MTSLAYRLGLFAVLRAENLEYTHREMGREGPLHGAAQSRVLKITQSVGWYYFRHIYFRQRTIW